MELEFTFLVITFITPPIASVPYKEDLAPLTISILSIISGLIFCSAAPPIVHGLILTPSIRTRV